MIKANAVRHTEPEQHESRIDKLARALGLHYLNGEFMPIKRRIMRRKRRTTHVVKEDVAPQRPIKKMARYIPHECPECHVTKLGYAGLASHMRYAHNKTLKTREIVPTTTKSTRARKANLKHVSHEMLERVFAMPVGAEIDLTEEARAHNSTKRMMSYAINGRAWARRREGTYAGRLSIYNVGHRLFVRRVG